MKTLSLPRVVTKGIQRLVSLQEKNGSFLSFSSNNEHDFSTADSYRTTFLNAWILLLTTTWISTEEMLSLRKKLFRFLLTQKSVHWSWNYWERNSQEAKDSPYPDDLDDTFCALAALAQYDKKMMTGGVFAHIVQLLTATEKQEGGPYRTWLIEQNASSDWLDIDIAVNTNVAYFLSLYEITLPNLQKYFEKSLREKKIASPYYPSFHAPLYFLARFYKGKQKEVIANTFWETREKNGSWENPLKTALAIVTLLSLGIKADKLESSIKYLLKTQKNGLWPAYGFCIDPSKNGKQQFAGSAALTTSFCLEALQKYQSAQQTIKKYHQVDSKENEEKEYYVHAIIKQVKLHFRGYDDELYKKSETLLERILKNDRNQQIPLIAYYFFQSIHKKNKKVTKSMLIKLGAANIFGWIAYTIYDDFLDDEGDPSLLPLATISLRQLTYVFDTFPFRKKRIQKLFHTTLNTVDQANARELQMRTSGTTPTQLDYLADKSIGHALGPLTVLLLLGYTQESREFQYIKSFFTHYLVVKQLNDDAHDWEEDLKKGQMTPVISLLLQKASEKKILKKRRHLKELFWREVIQEVGIVIHHHAKVAKIALRKSNMIEDQTVLVSFLEEHVRSADKALEEQKNVKAFLKEYKG